MGASADSDYEIEKSLRFNNDDSNYLNRDQGTPTNAKKFTLSTWFKLSDDITDIQILGYGPSGNPWYTVGLNSDSEFSIAARNSSGTDVLKVDTTAKLRDISAWYHVVVKVDTTLDDSNETNARAKIYINGVSQHGTYSQYTAVSNADTVINEARTAALFGAYRTTEQHFDGYIAETHFIDGQALEATSFGKTNADTGQWIPKKYGGTYGNNGFYLNFSDNSDTTATTLGKDSSGNGNNWTPNNFGILAGPNNDSLSDTPTNNYATFNPLGTDDSCTYKAGNMTVICNNASTSGTTIAVSSGKWYVEIIPTAKSAVNPMVGVCYADGFDGERQINESQMGGKGYGYIANGNKALPDGSNPSYGASYAIDDVIGIALDLDSAQNTVTFYKNNTSQGSIDIDSGTYVFGCSNGQSSSTIEYDIITGQRAFTHTPPTGFKALCTENLPDTTIKKGTDYFNTVLYTGSDGTQTITGLDFQPDFVWLKSRSAGYHHRLFDAVRGTGKSLRADSSGAEEDTDAVLTAFNSNGFSLTQGAYYGNESGTTYASWNWKESASAGFDIVTYAGDHNDGRTVSHSLGVIPEMIIVKRLTNADPWIVYHKAMDGDEYLNLDNSVAKNDVSNHWDASGTRPTSSVFSVGDNNSTNGSSQNYIAYLWASVSGYSKVGSYEGSGDSDGVFIYTGFKPAFFMVKNIDEANSWRTWDNKRVGYNEVEHYLSPDTTSVEGSINLDIDILSNGIKLRNTNDSANKSGNTYIYLAFAETPFKYANAR